MLRPRESKNFWRLWQIQRLRNGGQSVMIEELNKLECKHKRKVCSNDNHTHFLIDVFNVAVG